jgi:predicted alpha/beta-hydrolase family hydrolase
MSTRTTISLGPGDKSVTALRYEPTGTVKANLILAHGAGADQQHPFMVGMANGLAERGVRVITFNFPYTEAGRHIPDRSEVLIACYRAVVAQLRHELGELAQKGPLFIGGKSLGGRMATHLAAEQEPGIAGVVSLGYPLHPPGRPSQLRVSHLPQIKLPILIVQGSRDAFGSPVEIRTHLAGLRLELVVIEGGDHSFKQSKKVAPDPEVARTTILDAVARFVSKAPSAA